VNHYDYDTYVQNALRRIVRDVLKDVAKNGLHGPHHFYITFQTNRDDVEIPEFLREQHPKEVTIVLQHQFWDLEVTDEDFSVSLSFNDQHHLVKVPFIALISFLDPSVKFGLQFTPEFEDGSEAHVHFEPEQDSDLEVESKVETKEKGDSSAKIVSLDSFRKK